MYTDFQLVAMILSALVAPCFIHAVFIAIVDRRTVRDVIRGAFSSEPPPIAQTFRPLAKIANDN